MVGPFFQLLGAWTTDDEASILLGIGFSGYSFGTILIYPMSGQLCSVNFNGFGGWPLIYYVPGTCLIEISSLWVIYKTETSPNNIDKFWVLSINAWRFFIRFLLSCFYSGLKHRKSIVTRNFIWNIFFR